MVSVVISMRTRTSLLLALFLGMGMPSDRAQAQTNPKSNPAASPPPADSHSASWLFPIDKLDEPLPTCLHISGEHRDRLGAPLGRRFPSTSHFSHLARFSSLLALSP